MAKRKIRVSSNDAPRQSRGAAYARANKKGAGARASALIAWALAVAALGALGAIYQRQQDLGRQRVAEARQRVAAADKEARSAEATVLLARKPIELEIQEQVHKQRRIIMACKQLQLTMDKQRREAADQGIALGPQTPVAETPPETEEEGEEAEDERLLAELAKLQEKRARLLEACTAAYKKLREDYDAANEYDDPARLKHFYVRWRQSPFGPAAAFHTGEKYLFNKKDLIGGKLLYKDIVKYWPDSFYARYAQLRIDEISGTQQDVYKELTKKLRAENARRRALVAAAAQKAATIDDIPEVEMLERRFIILNKGKRGQKMFWKMDDVGFHLYNYPDYIPYDESPLPEMTPFEDDE